MNRTFERLAAAARLAPLATVLVAAGCYADVEGPPGYYPPPAYVATVDPVFYEGHAVYWYGEHWAYREGSGRWNYYRSEPAFLASHRAMGAPPKRYYERIAGGSGRM